MYSANPKEEEKEETEQKLVKWFRENNIIPLEKKWYCRATCLEEVKADLEYVEREPTKLNLIFADKEEHLFVDRLFHINKKNDFF